MWAVVRVESVATAVKGVTAAMVERGRRGVVDEEEEDRRKVEMSESEAERGSGWRSGSEQ